jgi:hypothetical protein
MAKKKKLFYRFVDFDQKQQTNIAFDSRNLNEIVKLARARMRQWNSRIYMARMRDRKFKDYPMFREHRIFRVRVLKDESLEFDHIVRITHRNTVVFRDKEVFDEFKSEDQNEGHIILSKKKATARRPKPVHTAKVNGAVSISVSTPKAQG